MHLFASVYIFGLDGLYDICRQKKKKKMQRFPFFLKRRRVDTLGKSVVLRSSCSQMGSFEQKNRARTVTVLCYGYLWLSQDFSEVYIRSLILTHLTSGLLVKSTQIFNMFLHNNAVKGSNSVFYPTSWWFLGKLCFHWFGVNWASTVNNSPLRTFALNSGYFWSATGKRSESNQNRIWQSVGE